MFQLVIMKSIDPSVTESLLEALRAFWCIIRLTRHH